MRRTLFDRAQCPVARTADLLGDWWTPIVLRELLLGRRRFNDIQERIGISSAILSQRLKRLEANGVVTRVPYSASPPRDEYRLTDKGLALRELVVAMWRFGDDWMFDESPGATVELVDQRTDTAIRPVVVDPTPATRSTWPTPASAAGTDAYRTAATQRPDETGATLTNCQA